MKTLAEQVYDRVAEILLHDGAELMEEALPRIRGAIAAKLAPPQTEETRGSTGE